MFVVDLFVVPTEVWCIFWWAFTKDDASLVNYSLVSLVTKLII